ncbi:hypothetical protein NNC19_15655 [Clostridium sp. SHJSY1]|uniref:DEAD/DEAH box helicase n=1 Tax=Clostridium sp. SHJSY1 TaxID=2942483 RepID=UPI002875939A|nr:DEAD/DEAH box helicase [Clostridium sp. SHJSY1]MDS0527127.1 hypothetical protein [Clostridium sp. SHJSY1]
MKTMQEKINEQKAYIKNQVINGQNRDHFNVIDMEAGGGKSIAIQEALADLYKIDPSRKSVLVMKFIDKNEDSYSACKRINELAGKEIAIAVNHGTLKTMIDKIKDYQVVIITHEKYKRLSINSKERQVFTQGRSILVLDEEIDMLITSKSDIFRINSFKNMISHKKQLKEIYNECVSPIKEAIEEVRVSENGAEGRKFKFLNYDTNMKKKFRMLKNLIDHYITDEHARQYQKNMLTCKKSDIVDMTKKDFVGEIKFIEQFYNVVCYINADNIYTYNNKIKYWKLENNILLDANGGFNHCYKLASHLFKCSNQAKIFDHSRWTVNVANNNVTKTAVKNYSNYEEEIERLIETLACNGKETLVITSKQYEESLKQKLEHCGKEKQVKVEHFGNIIGKNNWREFSQVLIPITYNLPEHLYIMKYLYYSDNNININTNCSSRKNMMKQFIDKDLERIRVTFIAGEIYQAIKRVDRDVTRDTEVFIICADEEVVDQVNGQLKNCKKDIFFARFEKKEIQRKEYDTNSRRENCHASNFIKLLTELNVGKYKKQDIKAKLGITQSSNFSRVLTDPEVLDFIKKKNIKIERNSIEIVESNLSLYNFHGGINVCQ